MFQTSNISTKTRNKVYEIGTPAKETDKAVKATTKGNLGKFSSKGSPSFKYGTQLLGLPYQFLDSADKRFPTISKELGRKYVENIGLVAPTVLIMPGRPKYLPGNKDKAGVTTAFIDAMNGDFSAIKAVSSSDEDLKLYDFQPAYIDYFQYVNVLCRTAAAMCELDTSDYTINGEKVNFLNFDWKNYRWDGTEYTSTTGALAKTVSKQIKKSVLDTVKEVKGTVSKINTTLLNKSIKQSKNKLFKNNSKKGKVDLTDSFTKNTKDDPDLLNSIENSMQNKNYIQFYMDPDGYKNSQNMSNTSQQSIFKQTLDGASSTVKDIAFLVDAGGGSAEGIQQLGEKALTALDQGLAGTAGSINASAGSIISRLLSSGKSVIKGENIIMPDIWGGCDMGRSFSISFHYKAPYGNTLCRYMEVLVPILHWIALAYPHATSPNSYSAPYLVKCYVPGGWSCTLGLITALEISTDVNEANVNADCLFTEADVRVTITELYSDMPLSPANDLTLFKNNSSLVEYLAVTCGLSLVTPQLSKKLSMMWNQTKNIVGDVGSTTIGKVMEGMDAGIASFVGL